MKNNKINTVQNIEELKDKLSSMEMEDRLEMVNMMAAEAEGGERDCCGCKDVDKPADDSTK
ncbi:hypothetical protein DF185_11980 [Marinifilum breve]|uniref:Uncharacterized protein n=1 Tax=Marinifilum breve TaxID=2184082 RepID=A0A2V3ZVD8_9BACT|nr:MULTISPECIES: hypothetical protein [Marinifilum]PXY00625.1 hypothetical protein DF185_11980 [Marinifilum breve]